jgi:hypothetical protein
MPSLIETGTFLSRTTPEGMGAGYTTLPASILIDDPFVLGGCMVS